MSATPPVRPHLDWYRKAAKKKLAELRKGHPQTKLAEAQLALAREHGYVSWRKLRSAIESVAVKPVVLPVIDPALVKQFSEALNQDRGDVVTIRALLDAHPELVNCQPWAPKWPHSAIEAAAHQCVWHRPKMREIAKLLLERGATCDLPTVARAGLLDEVVKRLDADPTLIDKPDAQGRTALYRAACKYGFLEESIAVVNELLGRGATVDIFTAASWLMVDRIGPMLSTDRHLARAVDPEGLTALHWVTRTDSNDMQQVKVARLLLDAGADANAEAGSQDGMRPLHCAAEWASSTELAGLLIDRGAEINAASSQSPWTPLDYATDRNRTPMRDYLRTRGAKTREELTAVDDGSVDSFLKSVLAGDLDAVAKRLNASSELVNRTGKHPQWGGRPQALHVSIEAGNQAMFDLLLSRGANANGDNALYDHWSPLMLANHWKRTAMRDELLRRIHHVSLIDALMMGDDATALRILKSGQIMFQRSMPNDATMLHFARTKAAAERLIEMGVPVDTKDKYGKTALDLAAEKGAKDVVDLLIEYGANASARTFAWLGDLERVKRSLGKAKPETALLKAAIQGKMEKVVRWIVKQGVDVNQPDEKGVSLLHTAAWEGNLNVVKMLVSAGANVHAEDSEYSATPSGWAQYAATNINRAECIEVSAYLEKQMAKKWSVKKLPVARQTHKVVQWKPIMDAALDGDSARIKKLVKEGADVNAVSTTPGAHRPLHRAIEEKKTSPRAAKHETAVRTLLELGADPHLRGAWDRHTALQLAAFDSPRFVPILLDAFKPLDFFHACVLLDQKRVGALLKKDPTLSTAREVNGYTGLHYVATSRMYLRSEADRKAQFAIATMLIDAGADVNATYVWLGGGDWPISVLYQACGRNNNPAMTELLMKAGALPYDNESVYHASDEGHEECLRVIQQYADKQKLADEATMCLRTQMHWGKSRGMEWLLEHGADPNSLHPQSGNSALHSAVKHGTRESVVKMLLNHGGDPSRRNRDGKLAIELAKPKSLKMLQSLFASARTIKPTS